MKVLYVSLLFALCNGFTIDTSKSYLGRPSGLNMLLSGGGDKPLEVTLDWQPVKSTVEDDPVTGYKVKVWQNPEVKLYSYEIVDGVKKLVDKFVPAKDDDFKNLDDASAKVFDMVGADNCRITIPDLKEGVLYEFKVYAVSKLTVGPASNTLKVKTEA